MSKVGSARSQPACSFCGKTQEQVVKLIAGPLVYICDECIDLCTEIITEEVGELPARRRPDDDEIESAARAATDAVGRLRALALRRHAGHAGGGTE